MADLERRLDEIIQRGARRTSLPPMGKAHRRAAHELGGIYRLATQSYGDGAARHVDCFLLPQMSAPPTARLSDAALAPKAVSAAAPPAVAEALFFHDVSCDLVALLAPWEGSFELSFAGPGEAVALFSSQRAASEARARLGGGMRGLFMLSAAQAERPRVTAMPPRGAERGADDAWRESSSSSGGGGAKKQVAKKVAAPAAKGNAWAALGGEEEDDWEVAADAE